MIYLLNSPILTAYGFWRFNGPLNHHSARARLRGQRLTSAIGHEASAVLLGKILGWPVAVNRINVQLQPGDSALVLRLTQRLPEGRVLAIGELAAIPHELSWLQFLGSDGADATRLNVHPSQPQEFSS